MTLSLDHILSRIINTPGARWWPQEEQLRYLRTIARMAGAPTPEAVIRIAAMVRQMGWQLQAPDIAFRPLQAHSPWTVQQRAYSTLFRSWGVHWDTLEWAALAGEGQGMGWLALDWFMEIGSVPWRQKSLLHEGLPPRSAVAMMWWQALGVCPWEAMGRGIPNYKMTNALAMGLNTGWDLAHEDICERRSAQRIARFYQWCGTYDLTMSLKDARLRLGREALEDILGTLAVCQGQPIIPWVSSCGSNHAGFSALEPTFQRNSGPTSLDPPVA